MACPHKLLWVVVILGWTSCLSLASGKAVLRWAEEFRKCEGPPCVNGGINTTRWNFEYGDGADYGPNLWGWGNAQLQCHTDSPDNVRVEANPSTPGDGMLVIQANRVGNGFLCENKRVPGQYKNYTSARLTTANKAAFKWTGTPNGTAKAIRIDVRLKVPMAVGTWPSVFMLPETMKKWCLACGPYGDGWCLGGEIDIMEHINNRPALTGNLQWGGTLANSAEDCHHKLGKYIDKGKTGQWHVMSVEWGAKYFKFYGDNKLYHTLKNTDWYYGPDRTNTLAPFDVPFHLVTDLAVGGYYPGFTVDDSAAPFKFYIDYIRVYDLL